ncbi:uncharacterized protein IL334_005999 [Kwoniella shivajii]|uniref:BRCT domain-containing protein n=1 Tax=Kwoniella shivajii TaxID=564305 RepID=A0ABZ1D5Z0_9TREE|nr:hypothetical protein IL334_005999 [Kwoniella shivajii]
MTRRNGFRPPTHRWTDSETRQLLQVISSSSTYRDAFFPPVGYRTDSIRYQLERELCIEVLRGTEWFRWMDSNRLIIKERGRWISGDHWVERNNPVGNRFKWIQDEVIGIKRILGPVRSARELKDGALLQWEDWRNRGMYTWYFDYVNLKSMRDPSWINTHQLSMSNQSSQEYTTTPESGSSHSRNTRNNDEPLREITSSCSSSSLSRPNISNPQPYKHTTMIPRFPQASPLERPLSTPCRSTSNPSNISYPSRPASTSKRRSYPSQSTSYPTPTSSSAIRHSKRARITLSSREDPQYRRLSERVGERAPDVIYISSDSDSDSDNQTDTQPLSVVQRGRRSSASSSASSRPDSDIPEPRNHQIMSSSVITRSRAIPYSSNRPFNESENLAAIRKLTSQYVPLPLPDGDTDSESSSRPPTPPLPDATRIQSSTTNTTTTSTVPHRPANTAVTTRSRAISPHFNENMFHDPNIRSYRLDVLHERLGMPLPPKPPARPPMMIEPRREQEDEDGLRRDEIRYSPLIITDGSFPDYPIDVTSPKEANNYHAPIEIIEDDNAIPLIIGNEIDEITSNRYSVDRELVTEIEEVDGLELEDEHEDMDLDPDESLKDADHEEHCNRNQSKERVDERSDESWEIIDNPSDQHLSPPHESSTQRPPTPPLPTTYTAETTNSINQNSLFHAVPQTSTPTSPSSALNNPLNKLPPMPLREVHAATVTTVSPMIRMLLNELRKNQSRCLSNIEVVIELSLLPFRKALVDLIELMGGRVITCSNDMSRSRTRYILHDPNNITDGEGQGIFEQRLTLEGFMEIIMDLRTKELGH